MIRKLPFLFITIIAIISNSCQKENMGDCFKTTGKVVLESRYLEAFDAIDLDDRINLYITYSSELKIEVEAGENLQNLIKTEVKSGLLKIENNNRCNWVRSYKKDINVFLSTPVLKRISFYGSGEVRFLNEFKTDIFKADLWEASGNLFFHLNCPDTELKIHTGPADLHCAGNTTKLVAYTNGLGHLNLMDLNAKEVLAVNTNSGKLSVHSDSLLNANIDGNGNIYYTGKPSIQLRDNGKGELFELIQ